MEGPPLATDNDARLALAGPRSSMRGDEWDPPEVDPRWEIPPDLLDEVDRRSDLRTILHIVLAMAMLGLVLAWVALSRSLAV